VEKKGKTRLEGKRKNKPKKKVTGQNGRQYKVRSTSWSPSRHQHSTNAGIHGALPPARRTEKWTLQKPLEDRSPRNIEDGKPRRVGHKSGGRTRWMLMHCRERKTWPTKQKSLNPNPKNGGPRRGRRKLGGGPQEKGEGSNTK